MFVMMPVTLNYLQNFNIMAHTPSENQIAIYDFIENGWGNGLINAVAGSGKSTTLVEGIDRIPTSSKILFLAFNKSIVTELKTKIGKRSNVRVSTLHGLGMAACISSFFECDVNEHKYRAQLWKWEDSLKADTLVDTKDAMEFYDFKQNILKLCDLCRLNLINTKEGAQQLADKHEINMYGSEITWAFRLIKWGLKNETEIDFTDMIFFPVIKKLKLDKFEWVFIDECQDLNACQRELFLLTIDEDKGRFLAVGDPKQCQPKGTKVLMSDFTKKNIEDIVVGDSVISYDIKKCQFVGFGKAHNVKPLKVLETHTSKRWDNIFTVKLESGDQCKYSSNHKCYVQLNLIKMTGKYAVYLMRKNNSFRIGISPCNTLIKGDTFGVVGRARSEKADCFWVLTITNSRKEAFLSEQLLSIKYGIPQMRFINNTPESLSLSQNDLDYFWDRVGDLNSKAKILLNEYARELDFPLWTKSENNHGGLGNSWKLSSSGMFKTEACNLIPEIMDMCIFDINNKDHKGRVIKKLIGFESLTTEYIFSDLISLNISDNHNYVADNILTSNCIYGFAGADVKSFNIIGDQPNTKIFPLSVCYRCDSEIIRLTQSIVKQIQYREGAPEGEVVYNSSMFDVRDGDMILCRVMAPLVDVCLNYIKRGIKAHVKGRDIGKNLINMIVGTNEEFIGDVIGKLEIEAERIAMRYAKNAGCTLIEARDSNTYVNYRERISVIEIVAREVERADEAMVKINEIFREDVKGVSLSTIHRSKGLENDRVFILCPDKLYHPQAMTMEWTAEQEENLVYVAYTRAKHFLGFIQDYDTISL